MNKSGWRYISQTIGFALLFAVTAWNLHLGKDILMSFFWGGVVYFVFQIISTVTSSVIARLLHDYEVKRIQDEAVEAAALEEEEEEEAYRQSQERNNTEASGAVKS